MRPGCSGTVPPEAAHHNRLNLAAQVRIQRSSVSCDVRPLPQRNTVPPSHETAVLWETLAHHREMLLTIACNSFIIVILGYFTKYFQIIAIWVSNTVRTVRINPQG